MTHQLKFWKSSCMMKLAMSAQAKDGLIMSAGASGATRFPAGKIWCATILMGR